MSALMPHILRSVALRSRDLSVLSMGQRYAATAVAVSDKQTTPTKMASSDSDLNDSLTMMERLGNKYIPSTAGRWKYTPADFKEFPERDIVNYPHPNKLEFHSPVRMGVVPDSWFRFFYEKTGETGGYLFLGGLATLLVQKELVVITHELARGLPIGIHAVVWYLVASHFLGKYVHADADSLVDKQYNWKQRQLQSIEDGIQAEGVKQSQTAGVMQYLFDAKRENVGLQLEGAYRQRVNQLHKQVKRQLDFLLEYESTKRRFELGHMAEWISQEVRKGITPQLEEAALQKCVLDLQSLAKKK